MTMRFIYTCMAIVALCFLAVPLMPAFNGIQDERAQILASAANGINLEVPPKVDDTPATAVAMDPDAAAVAGIEPAAGGDEPQAVFNGGFTNQAPAAFSDPQPAEPIE